MNDWALAVRKLDEIVKQTAIAATEGERAGLYAGARLLLSDLHGFVANEAGGGKHLRTRENRKRKMAHWSRSRL